MQAPTHGKQDILPVPVFTETTKNPVGFITFIDLEDTYVAEFRDARMLPETVWREFSDNTKDAAKALVRRLQEKFPDLLLHL